MNEKTNENQTEAKPDERSEELLPAVSGCLKLEWIKRNGDGYSCENLYVNKMKIASYYHKIIDYKEKPYRMQLLLPAIKKDKETFDFADRNEGKRIAEEIVLWWFKSALNCR